MGSNSGLTFIDTIYCHPSDRKGVEYSVATFCKDSCIERVNQPICMKSFQILKSVSPRHCHFCGVTINTVYNETNYERCDEGCCNPRNIEQRLLYNSKSL